MTEKEHQYYRRCTLCDPDLIVCPVCNGSGKVARPSGEDDLLVDEGTYPVIDATCQLRFIARAVSGGLLDDRCQQEGRAMWSGARKCCGLIKEATQ